MQPHFVQQLQISELHKHVLFEILSILYSTIKATYGQRSTTLTEQIGITIMF